MHMEEEEELSDADAAPSASDPTESTPLHESARTDPPVRSTMFRSAGPFPPTAQALGIPPTPLPAPVMPTPSKVRRQDVLRVCFADKPGISEIRQALKKDWSMDGYSSAQRRYSFVSRERAMLEIDIVDDYVVLNILNSPVDRLGLSRMPYRVKRGESSLLRNIVMAVAHFERCWRSIPEQRALRSNIEIEFTKVESRGRKRWGPTSQDEKTGNLSMNNQVEVIAGGTTYGIKITNKSSVPLYPHLFLFDCSDLSISKSHFPVI
jgi:hypothetical protein